MEPRRSTRAPKPVKRWNNGLNPNITPTTDCEGTPVSAPDKSTRTRRGKQKAESSAGTPTSAKTRRKLEPVEILSSASSPETRPRRRVNPLKGTDTPLKSNTASSDSDSAPSPQKRQRPPRRAALQKQTPKGKDKKTPVKAIRTPSASDQKQTPNKGKDKKTPAKAIGTPSASDQKQTPNKGKDKKTPAKAIGTPSASADTASLLESRRSSRLQKPTLNDKDKRTPVKLNTSSSPDSNQKITPNKKQSLLEKKLEWKFNVYGIPKCPLPCRESQFEEIWKFLFENVTEKNSGCMYVSGVPGTGKTVIVRAVVETMGNISDKEKKSLNFKYIYINGLALASPDKIWKRMFKGLELQTKAKGISTKECLKRLDSYFESVQRIPVILVVDELDQILDKQQSILYQLLEWSSHSKNMFSFVAIFNTMSLPEHGLAMRNYSRMGFKRAVFPPYNYEQLQAIVSNMLASFKATKLSSESVTLLSRKVAAISGDARRALEIARRALEIAESDSVTGIQAVSNAFKEIFSSAKIETIKHTSLLEQLILKAICDEVRCSGMEEVLTAKIYDSVVPKAAYEGMFWKKDEILKGLMRLAVMHLVIVEDNFPSLHKRVLLKVPVEDVNFALGVQND